MMLKHFSVAARSLLAILFNKLFDEGCWLWTDSMTTFIKKEGKSDYLNPGSYRPICISSYIGKIFERILEKRLRYFATGEDIVDEAQEGFLPSRNTTRYIPLQNDVCTKRSTP